MRTPKARRPDGLVRWRACAKWNRRFPHDLRTKCGLAKAFGVGSAIHPGISFIAQWQDSFRALKSEMRALHVSIDVTSLAIEELPRAIKEDIEEFLENHPGSPAARLRPRMGMVGDIWLAFVGPKLRTGATGLGHTPRDALKDFNRHFMEPIASSNGSEPH